MKVLPKHYAEFSVDQLKLLEDNHRRQAGKSQSLATLIRREIKRRGKTSPITNFDGAQHA